MHHGDITRTGHCTRVWMCDLNFVGCPSITSVARFSVGQLGRAREGRGHSHRIDLANIVVRTIGHNQVPCAVCCNVPWRGELSFGGRSFVLSIASTPQRPCEPGNSRLHIDLPHPVVPAISHKNVALQVQHSVCTLIGQGFSDRSAIPAVACLSTARQCLDDPDGSCDRRPPATSAGADGSGRLSYLRRRQDGVH